jgi:mono/diheme cytochrome c family protein
MRSTVLGAVLSMGLLAGSVAAHAASPPPAAAKDAATLQKSGDLFASYGCGGCHSLAGAGATGHVGPSFDGNANLDQAYIVDRVTNGSGPMPSFAGQMSPDEINALAAYIVQVKAK